MRRRTLLSLLAVLPVLACQQLPSKQTESTEFWGNSEGSVTHPQLASICRDLWEAELEADPLRATYLGDPRFHGEMPDVGLAARERRIEDIREFERRLRGIEPAELSDDERTTWEILRTRLGQERELLKLGLDDWTVDPLDGPQVDLLSLASMQPIETARHRAQLAQRWEAMAGYVEQITRNVRRARVAGKVAPRSAVLKVLGQLDALLATPPMDSPLVAPVLGGGTWAELGPDDTVASLAQEHLGAARHAETLARVNRHLQHGPSLAGGTRILIPADDDPLGPDARGELLFRVLRAVEDEIYPAFEEYRRVLRDDILPEARSDDAPGLASLPGGDAAYRALIRHHTSLDLDPEEVHRFGLEEIARIRNEMADLGERVFGTRDVAEVQRRLREDSEMFFASREEVESKAVEAMYRAERALPEYFGRLPQADCEVVRVPAHEEADTTIAYYREPAVDGSRPGRYFINTYAPETRPRYDAEVLAFHEAVPGHHLQIAISQELDGLPLVRRHAGSTAFVEGWALYTERLCDEMGLYSGDLDRLGVLSFDAWRASRLVVDTGLHALGWSRQRAIDYMLDNTLLAKNNIENEVDRYIAWPGQALAYKIGQREILALRDEAREKLGDGFSYPEFHDRVLENGAVTLAVLRSEIERWLEQR